MSSWLQICFFCACNGRSLRLNEWFAAVALWRLPGIVRKLGASQESRVFTVLSGVAILMIICRSSTALDGILLTLYHVLVLIGHLLINCQSFSRVMFGFCICHWAKSREKSSMPAVVEEKFCRRCIGLLGLFAARSCPETVRLLCVEAIAESGFDSRTGFM
jgi:hypothetical protein